jgi:hypothetical protein
MTMTRTSRFSSVEVSHDRGVCSPRRSLEPPVEGIVSELQSNRFVEWTDNGGQHGRHSSMLSAPLRPIHGRR